MTPPTQEPFGPSCDTAAVKARRDRWARSGGRALWAAQPAQPLRHSRFPSSPSFQGLRGCALCRGSVASSNHTTAICSQRRRGCRGYGCLLVHLGVERLQLWGWPWLTSLAPAPRLHPSGSASPLKSQLPGVRPAPTADNRGAGNAHCSACCALNRHLSPPPPLPRERGALLSPSPRCPPLHLEPKFFVSGQSSRKIFIRNKGSGKERSQDQTPTSFLVKSTQRKGYGCVCSW